MDADTNNTRQLFFELLDIESAEEREQRLLKECAGDPDRLRRLRELLDADAAAGDFLKGEPTDRTHMEPETAPSGTRISEGPGSSIGRYKLLQKIGEGGFGIVYMAEQREPVRRRVALKIIKLGMDTRQVVGRFEAERQALAMMDHPNIAKVLDAGATEAGRPYFVMELVKGIPITEFCDSHNLNTGERLELFAAVCRALHHAHQKGIIHRDIKPGNVLITMHDDRPVPKVIDFGIAKATQQELTEITIFTRFQEFIGTPAYMSPEQARLSGLDIDTRTDIYSLGVLLYELLIGSTPFDGRELVTAGLDEMRRRIREVDPVKPSTRLNTMAREEITTIARQRGENPEQLRRTIRGELDWIIMKALEKDRNRRYESAAALARDVENFLKDEPVAAAAPGLTYRAGKFARRHSTALYVVAIVLVLLITGIVSTTMMALRARRAELSAVRLLNDVLQERMVSEHADNRADAALKLAREESARAQRESEIARAVVQFMNEDIFSGVSREQDIVHELTVASLLERASDTVGDRFAHEPIVEAAVRQMLAGSFYTMGKWDEALEQVKRAHLIRRRELGETAVETLDSQILLGNVLNRVGSGEQGLTLVSNALEIARANLEPAHPTTIAAQVRLAWMHYGNGNREQARELIARAASLAREQPDVDPVDFIRALHLHARMVGGEDGEALYRESITYAENALGPRHPWTSNARGGLAAYLYDTDTKLPEAERLVRQTLVEKIRTFGDTHPAAMMFRSNLRLLLTRQQRWGEALFHDLKELQLLDRPTTSLTGVMDRLGKAPLPEISSDSVGETLTWKHLRIPPSSGWIFPAFEDDHWTDGLPGEATICWMRGELNVTDPNAFTPVISIRGTGDFDVFINGIPANPQGMQRDGLIQILVPTEEVRSTMKAGNNLIAIHGNGLADGNFPSIRVLRGPDLQESRLETSGFQSPF